MIVPEPCRIRVVVGPVLLATALARILAERGYTVDLEVAPDEHDVALVLHEGSTSERVEIILPTLDEGASEVRVNGSSGSRHVTIGGLDDLLQLILLEAPIRPDTLRA